MAIIENNYVNESEFVKNFDKKFYNMCSKSPCDIKYKLIPGGVLVYNLSKGMDVEPLEIEFNYKLTEAQNIKFIKDILIKDYPIIKIDRYEEPTARDLIKNLTTDNIDDVLLSKDKVKKVTIYCVEKRLDMGNSVVVRNLATDELSLWEMSTPISFFIKECFEDIDKASSTFKNKAIFKKVLPKKDE